MGEEVEYWWVNQVVVVVQCGYCCQGVGIMLFGGIEDEWEDCGYVGFGDGKVENGQCYVGCCYGQGDVEVCDECIDLYYVVCVIVGFEVVVDYVYDEYYFGEGSIGQGCGFIVGIDMIFYVDIVLVGY